MWIQVHRLFRTIQMFRMGVSPLARWCPPESVKEPAGELAKPFSIIFKFSWRMGDVLHDW